MSHDPFDLESLRLNRALPLTRTYRTDASGRLSDIINRGNDNGVRDRSCTIYLAGKLYGIKKEVADAACVYGVEYISTEDSHGAHETNMTTYLSDRVACFSACQLLDRKFKGMIAVVNTPDSFGTLVEIGYASGHGIPCSIIIETEYEEDFGEYIDNTGGHGFSCDCGGECNCTGKNRMFDAYWFACCMPHVSYHITWPRSKTVRVFSEIAATMRGGDSPIEDQLLRAMMDIRLRPRTQYQIGRYRVDFAFPDSHLVIECDGHDYHKTKEQRTADASRDRELMTSGWRVLRFTGTEIYKDANRCAEDIKGFLSP